MLNLMERFAFGINLDDSWRYAGVREPKSIIIPHLLSISLPEGRILDKIDDAIIHLHGDLDPRTAPERASLALAENLVDAHVDFVRCWFSWKFFEPNLTPERDFDKLLSNSYSEWPMDNFVKIMVEHGIGIIPVLACGYQRMLPQGLNVDSNRELYVKRAAVHARLLVRRYKDKIKFWQIENEPNWWRMHAAGGWRVGTSWIDPHNFTEALLGALNEAVHSEDGTAKTIINLEADTKLENAKRYAPYCDIIGLDFYPNYKSSSPINTSVLRMADEVSRECGKPTLISETGYPSGPLLLGYSASKQAEYVRQACSDAYALDSVNGVGLWRYIDTSWRSFPDQENHFGLFDSKGNPKPSWVALSETIRRLK